VLLNGASPAVPQGQSMLLLEPLLEFLSRRSIIAACHFAEAICNPRLQIAPDCPEKSAGIVGTLIANTGERRKCEGLGCAVNASLYCRRTILWSCGQQALCQKAR
jgi:hypothetical protein